MKIITLILVLLLSGCGLDNNNHGFGYEYDFVTDLGIEYRHDDGAVILTKSDIDSAYYDISECSGLSADFINLMVIISNNISRFGNDSAIGAFVSSPNLIVIKGLPYANSKGLVIRTLRHEILHYLLYVNNNHSDKNHLSEKFIDCNA